MRRPPNVNRSNNLQNPLRDSTASPKQRIIRLIPSERSKQRPQPRQTGPRTPQKNKARHRRVSKARRLLDEPRIDSIGTNRGGRRRQAAHPPPFRGRFFAAACSAGVKFDDAPVAQHDGSENSDDVDDGEGAELGRFARAFVCSGGVWYLGGIIGDLPGPGDETEMRGNLQILVVFPGRFKIVSADI